MQGLRSHPLLLVIDRPANLFYEVTTDCSFDESGLVHIRGIQNQRIYCSLRKYYAGRELQSIVEVSHLRSKANFEGRYGFDCDYGPALT